MYHIYHTDGFIIDSQDTGEANKLVTLYTADLGLVMASAQGVRTPQSKLRQSLQDLSFASLALVRGKELWRVTNARKLISLYDKRLPVGCRILMARVLGLVKRLVRGEARNPELYSIISSLSGFCFAGRASLKDKESLESVEIIASLRILASLGYAPEEEELSVYLKHVDEWNEELTMMMKGDKARALPAVARAIRESHL